MSAAASMPVLVNIPGAVIKLSVPVSGIPIMRAEDVLDMTYAKVQRADRKGDWRARHKAMMEHLDTLNNILDATAFAKEPK